MDGLAPPKQPNITPKGVVTRKSTDVLAVENPDVASALGWVNVRKSFWRQPGLRWSTLPPNPDSPA
jgi:hypothetical protein